MLWAAAAACVPHRSSCFQAHILRAVGGGTADPRSRQAALWLVRTHLQGSHGTEHGHQQQLRRTKSSVQAASWLAAAPWRRQPRPLAAFCASLGAACCGAARCRAREVLKLDDDQPQLALCLELGAAAAPPCERLHCAGRCWPLRASLLVGCQWGSCRGREASARVKHALTRRARVHRLGAVAIAPQPHHLDVWR